MARHINSNASKKPNITRRPRNLDTLQTIYGDPEAFLNGAEKQNLNIAERKPENLTLKPAHASAAAETKSTSTSSAEPNSNANSSNTPQKKKTPACKNSFGIASSSSSKKNTDKTYP